MFCFLSKFPSVVPCVRGFVYRLYSSADKPSRFSNLTKFTYATKKNGEATKERTKPKTDTKKAAKNPTKNLLKRSLLKKSAGAGGGCSKYGGGEKKPLTKCQKPDDFYVGDKCDMIDIPKANSKPFRYISYCLMPLIAGFAGYLFTHAEEKEHKFVPYDYMYKHQKRFAWRDGRTTLFHGPNNFIKDEEQYENKPDEWVENDLERRKKLRDQHAKEELERRRIRHEKEGKLKKPTENGKENMDDMKTEKQVDPELEKVKTSEGNGKK